MKSKSGNSPTRDDDEDKVWRHRPLKRVKKSADLFKLSPSHQKSLLSHSHSSSSPASQSSMRDSASSSGIPQPCQRDTPNNASLVPRSTQLQTNHQSRRKTLESTKKSRKPNCSSQSSNAIKSVKMQHPKTNKTEIETKETAEFCPICQAPFHSIQICSPEAHIQDCLQFEKSDNECPEGLSCDNTILSHYQRFNHDLLALIRSQTIPGTSSSIKNKEESKSLLKAEVMTSDSDFETSSCSRPVAATLSRAKPYEEDYEYVIKGDRVMCTPKTHTSSQIAASKSKAKNTARKSAKGAINRNRDKKLEQDTPQSTQNTIAKIESASKSGNSSRKRTRSKLSTEYETQISGSLLDYFSPSQKSCTEQKTSVAQSIGASHSPNLSPVETKVTHGSPFVSEDSLPFVKSDEDIFASDDSEPDCKDEINLKKTKAITVMKSDDDDGSDASGIDGFVKLTPKQDVTSIQRLEESDEDIFASDDSEPDFTDEINLKKTKAIIVMKSDDDDESANGMDGFVKLKPKQDAASVHRDGVDRSEPLFDILAGLDESSDEESESLFPVQYSNFQDDEGKSPNQQKYFNSVPPAPNQSDDDADDDLPKFNLTDGALEGFSDIDWDESTDIGGQGSKIDSAAEGQVNESREEESKHLVNTPSKDQEIMSSIDQYEGTTNQTDIDAEDEESQSLFNIPSKNEAQFPHFQSKLHNEVVCSENEEEEMEVDDVDEDEEPPNKRGRSSPEWRTRNNTSAISATDENLSVISKVHIPSTSSTAGVGATSKHKKQGTLDSFFGCKPAQKVEPPAEKPQQNGRWKGAKPTQKRRKGEGEGKKEWTNSSGKQCPFYKKMPGTSFTVDAFRYSIIPGCNAYFLSHFHYDHYGGLTKHFDQQLYCSKVTGNLVVSRLNVAAECVNNLPMNTPCVIDDVEVTLLDANHCPGAVMFLYRLKSGAVYLHTGDFRADTMMEQYPALSRYHVNQLYLDTTYCDPQYKFPSQKEVIEFAVKTAIQAVRWNKKTLIVCGTYTIGKEKVFRAIAEALKCKVFVESRKFKVLECLEDNDLLSLLTSDIQSSHLHVIGMNMFSHQKLKEYLSQHRPRYDNILAFKPTGWTHSDKVESPSDIKPSKSGASTIYGIPYSEHSSYSEMKRFVQFLRADKILPTVNNGNAKARKAMEDIFKRWMEEDGHSSSPTKLKSGKIMNFFKR